MTGWDISGEEQLLEVTSRYFWRRDVIVLVYSIGDQQSFDNIAKWLELAKAHRGDSPFILVGNKSEPDYLEEDSPLYLERQRWREQGSEFAKANSMLFFETSALTGAGCQRLLFQLASLLVE